MFDSGKARSARTLLALTAATTVGLTGLAGTAQAVDDDDERGRYGDVDVTVCKQVIDRYQRDYRDGGDYGRDNDWRNSSFAFTIRFGGHYERFELAARGRDRCETFEVERGDYVRVTEHRTRGYVLDHFRVHGVRNVDEGNRSVSFTARRDDIRVVVINKKRDRRNGGDWSYRASVA